MVTQHVRLMTLAACIALLADPGVAAVTAVPTPSGRTDVPRHIRADVERPDGSSTLIECGAAATRAGLPAPVPVALGGQMSPPSPCPSLESRRWPTD